MTTQGDLTSREREIVNLMVAGLNNREIGEQLFLAYETVKWYSKRIYSKLNVKNRVQLIAAYKGTALAYGDSFKIEPLSDPFLQHTFPFVGRKTALETLHRWFEADSLVLVTGPGGIGKTRLAGQYAEQVRKKGGRKVYFVPLQTIHSEERLIFTLADVFQIALGGSSSPLAQLIANFPKDPILLVLDNFESLSGGESLLSALLEARDQLQVLITSRNMLQNRGAKRFTLDGFKVDSEDQSRSGAQLLFERVAAAAQPHFSLESVYDCVTEIVKLVGGSPLAIELAAGWVATFSCSQILEELRQSIGILESESIDLDPRHRNMELVCQQSWERLDEQARARFLKLSTFEGSFEFDAAREITGVSMVEMRQLINYSMVRFDGRSRYEIHPVLRRFGRGLIEKNEGDFSEIELKLTAYFLKKVAEFEPLMRSGSIPEVIDAISTDFHNIIQAWEYGLTHRRPDLLIAAILPLARFFEMTDRSKFGAVLFRRSVEKLPVDSLPRMIISLYMGWHEIWLGNTDDGSQTMFDAIHQLDAKGLSQDHPFVVSQLSFNESYPADVSDQLLKRYLGLAEQYQALGEVWSLGWVEYGLGNLYRARDQLKRSEEVLGQSFRRFQNFNDMYGIGWAADALSTTYSRQNKFEPAWKMAEQLYLISDRLAYNSGLVIALEKFGLIERAQNNDAAAYRHFRKMLEYAARNKNATNIMPALLNIGALLAESGHNRSLAVSLFSAVKNDPSSNQGWFDYRAAESEAWLARLNADMPTDQYLQAQSDVAKVDLIDFVHRLLRGVLPMALDSH